MNRTAYVYSASAMLLCLIFSGCQFEQFVFFEADATSGPAPLTVLFADTSFDGAGFAWHWQFGDGAESTESAPAHVYTEPGVYTVTMDVTLNTGTYTRVKTDYITVTEPNTGAGRIAGQTDTVMLPGNVDLELVWVPAGSFTMGSPEDELDRNGDEGPQHLVY